jgi:hypothetical protein
MRKDDFFRWRAGKESQVIDVEYEMSRAWAINAKEMPIISWIISEIFRGRREISPDILLPGVDISLPAG